MRVFIAAAAQGTIRDAIEKGLPAAAASVSQQALAAAAMLAVKGAQLLEAAALSGCPRLGKGRTATACAHRTPCISAGGMWRRCRLEGFRCDVFFITEVDCQRLALW
ncbi:hypothetical protein ACKKBG_A03590 [Auxenochlorella protothecoides x Auxenochlorella symbiontica]